MVAEFFTEVGFFVELEFLNFFFFLVEWKRIEFGQWVLEGNLNSSYWKVEHKLGVLETHASKVKIYIAIQPYAPKHRLYQTLSIAVVLLC